VNHEGGAIIYPYIVRHTEGNCIQLNGIKVWVIEDGTRTRNELSVVEAEVLPGSTTPPSHVHQAHEEIFYVLDGELEFLVDGNAVVLTRGDTITVPIGVAHTFCNPTDTPARFLNTFSPSQYVHYFEDLAELVKQGNLNPKTIGEVMKKYNTEAVR
jgi:quercetin dioxygenase-like cupin family protein